MARGEHVLRSVKWAGFYRGFGHKWVGFWASTIWFRFLTFCPPPPPPEIPLSTHSASDRSLVECFTSTSPYYYLKPSSLQLFDLLSGCFMLLLSSLSQIKDATPCWGCVLFPTMSTSGHFQFYRVYPGTPSTSQSLSINPRTPETNNTNTS